MSIDLDALLDAIDRRRVVPVVGRGLSAWVEGESRVTLDERVAARLAAKLGLGGDGVPAAALRFTEDVALAYKAPPGRPRREEARRQFRQALAGPADEQEIPEALRELAQIEQIDLFLSVTFDDLLEKALMKEQPARRVLSSTGFGLSRPEDLAAEPRAHVHVHHLLGSGGDFALFDDERVAAVLQLKDILKGEISELCKHLERPSSGEGPQLLFLGCSFPDWLMRFLVLAFARGNQRPEGSFVDRDLSRTPTLRLFLETWEIEPSEDDVHTFVHKLVQRRQERIEKGTPSVPESATAVLSCHQGDLERVRGVETQLRRWGIDTALVQPAQAQQEVRRTIQTAALYVTWLSENVMNATAQDRARMEEEWRFVAGLKGQAAPISAHIVALARGAEVRTLLGRPGYPLSSPGFSKWDSGDDVDLRLVRRLFDLGKFQLAGLGRDLTTEPKLQLFCIYAEEDAAAVEKGLAACLKVPWIQLQHLGNLPPGADWKVAIQKADAFLLLVSPGALDGQLAQAMITCALAERANVPRHRVLYRDCNVGDNMMSFDSLTLSSTNAITMSPSPDSMWKEIGSCLQRELLDRVTVPPGQQTQ